uniref:Protein NATD1 n=1 Tax=Gallus gallus TaxID=9031 RepID=A0A8V0ZR94_CHICK
MAHSAPLGLLEQGCPIQVEHDRKRRQFTVRLNGTCQALCRAACVPGDSSLGLLLCHPAPRTPSQRTALQSPLFPCQGCHDRAVLLYEYVGKRIVDLQHTEVPDAYRGRGIAKHLAKAALDFVVEEDLKAHLTCWYIQKYVKENPLPQYLEHLQP